MSAPILNLPGITAKLNLYGFFASGNFRTPFKRSQTLRHNARRRPAGGYELLRPANRCFGLDT